MNETTHQMTCHMEDAHNSEEQWYWLVWFSNTALANHSPQTKSDWPPIFANKVLLGHSHIHPLPCPATTLTAPAAETSAAWLEPCYLLLQIWVCSNLMTLFGHKANFIYIVLSWDTRWKQKTTPTEPSQMTHKTHMPSPVPTPPAHLLHWHHTHIWCHNVPSTSFRPLLPQPTSGVCFSR